MDNLSSKQWALLLTGSLGLAALNIFILQIFIVGIIAGALTGTAASRFLMSLASGQKAKAIEAAKIDGRTQAEWYEIVSNLGKEEYERLSRPALDGLEGSTEGYGGWDVEKLVGRSNFVKLRKQWYPEKHCKYCGAFTHGIPGNCDWDGPCYDFQYHSKLERRNKAFQDQKKRKQDELVIKGPIRASITNSDLKKEVQEIQTELVKWEREFEKYDRQYTSYMNKYDKKYR